MKFKIKENEYEFDGNYTLSEAMLFFDKANVGMAEVQGELARGNPYVTATMMFVLKKRANEAVRWQDMQAFTILDFRVVLDEDDMPDGEEGEPSAGASPDPTEAPGTTPEPGTATTS